MGKIFLIEATVEADYTWLGVAILVGTMVSLVYYLRVLAAVWMSPQPAGDTAEPMPAIAGASPEADAHPPRGSSRCGLVVGSGILCAAATVAFGVYPDPLIDWATHAAGSLGL
jgi:NADH-quinone oxidoreductase subunit N